MGTQRHQFYIGNGGPQIWIYWRIHSAGRHNNHPVHSKSCGSSARRHGLLSDGGSQCRSSQPCVGKRQRDLGPCGLPWLGGCFAAFSSAVVSARPRRHLVAETSGCRYRMFSELRLPVSFGSALSSECADPATSPPPIGSFCSGWRGTIGAPRGAPSVPWRAKTISIATADGGRNVSGGYPLHSPEISCGQGQTGDPAGQGPMDFSDDVEIRGYPHFLAT